MNFEYSHSEMITYAYELAHGYYDDDTLKHACRVAEFIDQNPMIEDYDKEPCIAIALLHDAFEDTILYGDLCNKLTKPLDESVMKALCALTKPDHLSYVEYIQSLRTVQGETWRKWAYWVKVADMKDHLTQRDTLTDKLKEKYWEALPYLL